MNSLRSSAVTGGDVRYATPMRPAARSAAITSTSRRSTFAVGASLEYASFGAAGRASTSPRLVDIVARTAAPTSRPLRSATDSPPSFPRTMVSSGQFSFGLTG